MAKSEIIVQCKLKNSKVSGSSCGSRWCETSIENGQSIFYTVLWLKEKFAKLGNVVSVAHPDTGRTEVGWEIIEIWDKKEKKDAE